MAADASGRFEPQDDESLPRHIAIIMDGNGRWAHERGLARRAGHEAGIERAREITRACGRKGIDYLTLFAFSTENWNRPRVEVEALMLLLRRYLANQTDELLENNVRLRAIGNLDALPSGVQRELQRALEKTRGANGLTLVLALSYGGRNEIVRAARRIAAACGRGEVSSDEIDEETLAGALDTSGIPDPDMVIRTAGEMRLSNFLLWQTAYSEYHSVPVCWPDFTETELDAALAAYRHRDRKFGVVEEPED
jgi:undecaprenyl diphosphate synthase